MYDIILLSYYEPNADNSWQELLKITPWAKRVDGVKGIMNAHKKAAEIAKTECFYVVDADAKIINTFDFSYKPKKDYKDFVHVWRSKNPINDLIYGYGGVKLFPRKLVLNFDESVVDFTTTIGKKFKVMEDIASIGAFNTTPFNAWKSGFRECVKLASQTIINQHNQETQERLDIWCTVGKERLNGKYCIDGSIAGREFGQKYKNNKKMLEKINDFDWLKEQFSNLYE